MERTDSTRHGLTRTSPSTRLDQATVDLLGVLAYGELTAFERLASDAARSDDRRQARAGHDGGRGVRPLLPAAQPHAGRVDRPGGGDAALRGPAGRLPRVDPPNDWLESIIKAYVGDGLATDFYREVAAFVADGATRGLVLESLADTGQAEFAVAKVRAAIAADPTRAGPAGAVGPAPGGRSADPGAAGGVERDALTELLVGGSGDLAGVGRLLARLTDRHTARMAALGLQS
jgi:hypothetical protein